MLAQAWSLGLCIPSQDCVSQVLLHRRLLLLIGNNVDRAQAIDDIFRFSEVNLIESVSDLVFHIFDHPADVGDVRRSFADLTILFELESTEENQKNSLENEEFTCLVRLPPRFMVPDASLCVCSQSIAVDVSL